MATIFTDTSRLLFRTGLAALLFLPVLLVIIGPLLQIPQCLLSGREIALNSLDFKPILLHLLRLLPPLLLLLLGKHSSLVLSLTFRSSSNLFASAMLDALCSHNSASHSVTALLHKLRSAVRTSW